MTKVDPSLTKRIKRHVIGREREFFVVVAPGTEALCRRELEASPIGLPHCRITKGGVVFTGKPAACYRVNLHARLAVRVLMRLTHFKATNFRQLEKKTAAFPWELYFTDGCELTVKGTCRHSRLYHHEAVSQRIRAGIAQRLEVAATLPGKAHGACLHFRMEQDRCLLSLDSSGNPLYRRGLKTHRAKAPLRETLAAAVLDLAGFEPGLPLVDPMCGAGTFSLEAAMQVKGIPPGWFRHFAFEDWPAFRPNQWQHMKKVAGNQIKNLPRAVIYASDRDNKAIKALSACLARHALLDAVSVSRQDLFDLTASPGTVRPGIVVVNPPYGIRLGSVAECNTLILGIVRKFQEVYRGWRLAMLVPDKRIRQKLPIRLKSFPVQHGGLHLALLTGRIEPKDESSST